jgi:hypothetical protein
VSAPWYATFWDALMHGGLASIGFAFFSIWNWSQAIRGWSGKKGKSLFPIVGGLLGCLGIWLSGVPGSKKLCWIPFLIDPGSILMVVDGVYQRVKRRKN